MTTNKTNQTLNTELDLLSEVEISEEMLEDVSGGYGFGPREPKRRIRKSGKRIELPTDGGATGSW